MAKDKTLRKNSFVEGTLIATLSIVMVKIMGMLYVIPFYGMINTDAKSLYGIAYSIYSIFLDISSAGLPIAMSKIIKEYDTLGKIEAKERAYNIGRTIIMSIALVVFTILFLFAPQIAHVLVGNNTSGNSYATIAMAIRCVSFSLLVVPFLSVTKGYLQGHNIIGVSSASQVIEQIVRILIILTGSYFVIHVLHLSHTIAVCVAVTGAFFGAVAALAYIVVKLRKHKKEQQAKIKEKDTDITNKEIVKKIFSYAIPFIIIDTMFSMYAFVDMFLVLRTMGFLGFTGSQAQTISTYISTQSTKISIIISSLAMGMTTSLIPTIVSAFTLKNFEEVNNKLNQALQMIIMISLPMSVGLSLLCKPMWSIFYSIENPFGYHILSIGVFTALMCNLFMITSSTLQSLNKFKLVYKSSILGLLTNMLLDVPMMLLYNKIGIPPYLGASTASLIGYGTSTLYALYHLKKEHALSYGSTFNVIKQLIIPTISMVAIVILTKLVFTNFIFNSYDNKMMCIVEIACVSILGALTYLFILFKTGTLERVFGKENLNKILRKITFNKVSI